MESTRLNGVVMGARLVTHVGGHLRRSFDEWVLDDMPDQIAVEDDFTPEGVRHVHWRTFLSEMAPCTDWAPRSTVEHVFAGMHPEGYEDIDPSTYGGIA